jgi:hypothetical protein
MSGPVITRVGRIVFWGGGCDTRNVLPAAREFG